MTEIEIWKPIQNLPYYEVSSFGRLRVLDKMVISMNGKRKSLRKGKILTQHISKQEYLTFSFYQKCTHVHRVVATAFHANPEKKPMVNHKDGNKSNNHKDNLEWCTRAENEKHAFSIGLKSHKGENHNQAKLSGEDIINIRKLVKEGIPNIEIAKIYSLSRSYISNIKSRKVWDSLH